MFDLEASSLLNLTTLSALIRSSSSLLMAAALQVFLAPAESEDSGFLLIFNTHCIHRVTAVKAMCTICRRAVIVHPLFKFSIIARVNPASPTTGRNHRPMGPWINRIYPVMKFPVMHGNFKVAHFLFALLRHPIALESLLLPRPYNYSDSIR